MKSPTKPRNILHYSLSMFPHYLGKIESFKFIANYNRKIKKRLRLVFDKNETLNGDRRIVFYLSLIHI